MKVSYVAHRNQSGETQDLHDHLEETADLAASFASAFGAQQYAHLIGLYHDLGKMKPAFQRRVMGGTEKVEHSATGAYLLPENYRLLAYCIAGHHGGLPDGGSLIDSIEEGTLQAKLKRAKNEQNKECDIKKLFPDIEETINAIKQYQLHQVNLGSTQFWLRMLFSCLVDADYLNTEPFMQENTIHREKGESIVQLYSRMELYLKKFVNPQTELNKIRNDIRAMCLEKAKHDKGLFSLTVPTGTGKTITSLAFALQHAKEKEMERIIYVIPYTTIIEQTVKVFRDILGNDNVLEHHYNVEYKDMDETSQSLLRLASENWDKPIVVTTNVQFFESLFASQTSRCRKLHNIANSVIIFDEAQMLPQDYMIPALFAITELVQNYGCSAVLCTATQPSVQSLLPRDMPITELCENYQRYYQLLQRVTFRIIGRQSNTQLADIIAKNAQVLCVVNTKAQARDLYKQCHDRKMSGVFHLSTNMHAQHRHRVIEAIKKRLSENKDCRVISTSLIEAGVDIDFPTVMREICGLDSIIQSAGRCNRENKRKPEDSVVYIFLSEETYERKIPYTMRLPYEIGREIIENGGNLNDPQTVTDYFRKLFLLRREKLDKHNIMELMKSRSIPFRKISDAFHLIDDASIPVIIPEEEILPKLKEIRSGHYNKELFRSVMPYAVSISRYSYANLMKAGKVTQYEGSFAILEDMQCYLEDTGLSDEVEARAIQV